VHKQNHNRLGAKAVVKQGHEGICRGRNYTKGAISKAYKPIEWRSQFKYDNLKK